MAAANMPWWKWGVIGGLTLSLATVVKLVRYLAKSGIESVEEVTALKVVEFGAFLFTAGFACGISLWAIQHLFSGPRWLADAMSGVVVLEVLFLCCAFVFEPTWLTTNQAQGFPMFVGAAVLGLVLGPWIGRDVRKELK